MNFRFFPHSGYTIGLIFSDAYSSKRPEADALESKSFERLHDLSLFVAK